MTGYEELPAAAGHNHVDAALFALGYDVESLDTLNILAHHLAETTVRHIELVVKSSEYGIAVVVKLVTEHTRYLAVENTLGHSIVMIEAGKCGPAYIKSRCHVGACPVKNLAQFIPIINLFKVDLLYRSAGNYESVVILVPYVLKCLVELLYVFARSVT